MVRNWGFFFTVFLLILTVSCSKNAKDTPTNNEISTKPISVLKYDTPKGADPSVPAELGGEGFDKIADSLGYTTNTDFFLYGDPKAKKGGVFRSYTSYFPATYRGAGKGSNEAFTNTLQGFVYERLLGRDKDLNFRPYLASHWKISEDKMTYWFRIDPDARWSDGMPVVADDVIYTLKLIKDEDLLAPYTSELFSSYTAVKVSKYIVKITSDKLGWKQFLNVGIWMDIYPAHHLKKIDGATYLEKYQYNMLPGTGAYVLDKKSTIKGKVISLKRISHYWAEDKFWNVGLNNFDEIRYEVISDENLAFEKFKKGDLDYFSVSSSSDWVNQLNFDNPGPGLEDILPRGLIQKKKIYNFYPKSFNGFAFNMRKPPFDDIKVRKALAMLYNRDQIIEKIELNEAEKIKSHWPFGEYENPNNEMVEYDPKTANDLLDEAGWSLRNEEGYRMHPEHGMFELTLNILTGREKYYTPFQDDLKKSGIKLNIKQCDFPTQVKIFNSRSFKMIHVNWYPAGAPNLTAKYHSMFADLNETNNMTGIKNDRIDEISDLYNEEFDPKKQVRYVQEVDSIAAGLYHYAFGYKPQWAGRIVHWNKFSMPDWVWSYRGGGTTTLWWYDKEKVKKLEQAKKDKSIKLPVEDTIVDYWNIRGK